MELLENPTTSPDRKPMDFRHLYEAIDDFTLLPGEISGGNVTKEAFQAVYGSPEAAKAKNIVYIYLTDKPIPRVKGESRIVYIGETKHSFRQRNFFNAEKHAKSLANSFKYNYIAENYGPIRIAISPYQLFVDPAKHAKNTNLRKQAEGQLLWWYFKNHCEFPPVNYTQTKVRNEFI